jgi:DNA-binding IscR family transcriptional regulator
VTLADVIRAVDGPLVTVRDERPPSLSYEGSAAALLEVWVALRSSVRQVLDEVTLESLVSRRLPKGVHALAETEGAWDNP